MGVLQVLQEVLAVLRMLRGVLEVLLGVPLGLRALKLDLGRWQECQG